MVATGNWGCGAFNGNLQLKAVIQYIAAAQVGWTSLAPTLYQQASTIAASTVEGDRKRNRRVCRIDGWSFTFFLLLRWQAGRDVAYFAFNESGLVRDLTQLVTFVRRGAFTVRRSTRRS